MEVVLAQSRAPTGVLVEFDGELVRYVRLDKACVCWLLIIYSNANQINFVLSPVCLQNGLPKI